MATHEDFVAKTTTPIPIPEELFKMAREAKRDQGAHEMEFSFCGEAGLHESLNSCTKNPGHTNFIPISELRKERLPLEIATDEVAAFLVSKARETVRLTCGVTSAARPRNYCCGAYAGRRDFNRVGSGRVWSVYKERVSTCIPCPFEDCREAGIPCSSGEGGGGKGRKDGGGEKREGCVDERKGRGSEGGEGGEDERKDGSEKKDVERKEENNGGGEGKSDEREEKNDCDGEEDGSKEGGKERVEDSGDMSQATEGKGQAEKSRDTQVGSGSERRGESGDGAEDKTGNKIIDEKNDEKVNSVGGVAGDEREKKTEVYGKDNCTNEVVAGKREEKKFGVASWETEDKTGDRLSNETKDSLKRAAEHEIDIRSEDKTRSETNCQTGNTEDDKKDTSRRGAGQMTADGTNVETGKGSGATPLGQTPAATFDPKPHYVCGYFRIHTAKHVVFDDEEARNTTVEFFYDDHRDTRHVLCARGVSVEKSDLQDDYCVMICVSHDPNLGPALDAVRREWFQLWPKVKDILYGTDASMVVSHPHGCSKQFSVGRCLGREWGEFAEGQGWYKYSYTAATCPGSSGAPVWVPGRDGLFSGYAPHSFSVGPGDNRSAAWFFWNQQKGNLNRPVA